MPLSLPSLGILVLGPLQVQVDGGGLGRPLYDKLQGLLAYLALEPARPHARDHIAGLFWPQLPPEAARANLRQALFNLKRALGRHMPVQADRDMVRFLPDKVRQVDGLEVLDPGLPGADTGRLERAAALFRGEFLDGLEMADAPDFMAWRDHWRSIFLQRQLDLLEILCGSLAQQGRRERALAWAQARSQRAPRDEAAQRALWAAAAGTVASSGLQARGRRQITFVHASLGIDGETDAERVLERLAQWHESARVQMRSRGGHVCLSPGNVLLACFGHPQAQEDAARRAVRAALRLCHAAAPPDLTVRVAVHTAWVVTGSNPDMPDMLGQATQAVARMAEQATAGTVLISAATRQMVAACFDFGQDALPGASTREDGPLYRVADDRAPQAGREAFQAPRLPLVGRQRELSRLAAWGSEALYQGLRLVVVRGDAGLGKSRLLAAFSEQLAQLSWRVRQLFCSAEAQHTPLLSVVACLGARRDSPDGDPWRIQGRLGPESGTADSAEALERVGTLLGLGGEGGQALSEPQRAQAMAVLARMLLAGDPGGRPVLLAVEDVHWADPSTLALLAQIAAQPPVRPLLVVLTVRSGHALPEGLAPLCGALDLAPLDDGAIAALVSQVVPELPASQVPNVVARAEGIPLFAEALARAVAYAPVHAGELPGTLQDLLTAQLDATGAMQVAQAAAAIGREFDWPLLQHVADADGPALARGLHALQQARLIERRYAPGGPARYGFRHALIQQAAISAQTRKDRCAIHERVALALRAHFPQQVRERPEILAWHCTQAGMADDAITWWQAAGTKAWRSAAYAEAVDHLRQGLALLDKLRPGPQREARELELLLPLGPSLVALMGYGAPEAIATFDRAAALCPAEDGRRFAVLWGLWLVWSSRPDASFGAADAWAGEMLAIASRTGNAVQLVYAHAAWANDAVWLGHLERTEYHIRQALHYARGQAHAGFNLGGHDPRVAVLGYRAWVRLLRRRPQAAVQAGGRACALARALDHPESLCFALSHLAVVHRLSGQASPVARLAREIAALAARHGLPLWQAVASMLGGWALVMSGQAEQGMAQLQGSAAVVRQAMPSALGAFLHALAEAQLHLSDWPGVLQTTEEALAMCLRVGDGFHLPDLYRLRAQALQQSGACDAARQSVEQALEHTAAHPAALWQARAQALSVV